jgi:hypothetical protein
MQQTVFARSVSGQFVKKYLEHELIVTAPSEKGGKGSETIGQRRERLINEVLGK